MHGQEFLQGSTGLARWQVLPAHLLRPRGLETRAELDRQEHAVAVGPNIVDASSWLSDMFGNKQIPFGDDGGLFCRLSPTVDKGQGGHQEMAGVAFLVTDFRIVAVAAEPLGQLAI